MKLPDRRLVAAAAVAIQLCLGSVYAWSVFVKPLSGEFGWTRSAVSLAFTFFLAAYSAGMLAGGFLQDRYGPRRMAVLGGLLLGTGYLLASGTGALWWLYLSYGVLAGVGVGIAYVCPIATCLKWFPDKRGLASGLSVAGFGAGSLLVAPLAVQAISLWGWRWAFVLLGAVFVVVVVTAAMLLVPPPDGWSPEACPVAEKETVGGDEEMKPRRMAGTGLFKRMWLVFALGAAAGLAVIGHLAPFVIERGLSAHLAALIVGVMAVCNGAGRLIWGALADIRGKVPCLWMSLSLLGFSIAALALTTASLPVLFLAVGGAGLGFGGMLALFPSLTADYFGTRNLGANYGLLFTAYGAAGLLGPFLCARIHELNGGYRGPFLAFALAALLAAAVVPALGRSYRTMKRSPALREQGNA